MRPKPGCPCKLVTCNICVAIRMLGNNQAHDVADLQRLHFPNVAAEMIRKRLVNCGLKAYIHYRKSYLSPEKKKVCLEWALVHWNWTLENWKAVIFSNESKFNLFGLDGHCYCSRRPWQEFDEQYVWKEVKHGGGSVMVWGYITAQGLGQICCIEGNMDAKLYVKILNDNVLGTLKDLGINKEVYFQQDNDLKHTSHLAQNWFT